MSSSNPHHDVTIGSPGEPEHVRLRKLADSLDGTLVLAGDPDWDAVRQAWHLSSNQLPAAVVVAGSEADVVTVVVAARELGLRVAPQATGHNSAPLGSLAGSILLKTSSLRDVSVDAEAGIARAGAGAQWQDVTAATTAYGLAGLAGTARDVGVVGYLLGGGLSWFARSHGLASNHIVAIELVTADGEYRRVDAGHDPDLFWALHGGGGNFGIVTAIEFRLFPLVEVMAGVLFWPIESAREILQAWTEWTATVPEEVTSIARLMSFPPVPELPEPLRGRSFVIMDAVSQLSQAQTDEVLAPLRALGPEMDTFAVTAVSELWKLHMDPDGPVPGTGDSVMLREVTLETIDAILANKGPELLIVELRHLGGAAGRADSETGAVSAFAAGYSVLTGGVALDEEMEAAARRATDKLLNAVADWRADVDYLNFRESSTTGDELYGAELHSRLRALKAKYDPANLMHSNQQIEPAHDLQPAASQL